MFKLGRVPRMRKQTGTLRVRAVQGNKAKRRYIGATKVGPRAGWEKQQKRNEERIASQPHRRGVQLFLTANIPHGCSRSTWLLCSAM